MANLEYLMEVQEDGMMECEEVGCLGKNSSGHGVRRLLL